LIDLAKLEHAVSTDGNTQKDNPTR
jgi:hypothetical protein